MNMDTLAVASGVVIRSDPVTWWMVMLAMVAAFALSILLVQVFVHWNVSERSSAIIAFVFIGASVVGIVVSLSHWSGSAESSNIAAIESRYGVSSLTAIEDRSFFPGPSKPIAVTFRDSQGTHKGKVVITGNRAILRVDNIQPDSEYLRGASYSYSGTAVGGSTQSTESGKSATDSSARDECANR